LSLTAKTLLGVAAAALFLLGLGAAPFGDPPEGFHAAVARDMLRVGDWITPQVDGVRYFDKPPLFYWLLACALPPPPVRTRRGPGVALRAGPGDVLVHEAPLENSGAWLMELDHPVKVVRGRGSSGSSSSQGSGRMAVWSGSSPRARCGCSSRVGEGGFTLIAPDRGSIEG
jgi:hypothetical protein